MKRILAQTAANNQILVRYTRTHTSNKGRILSDNAETKNDECLANLIARAEDLGQLIRKSCYEYKHTNFVYPVVDGRGYARTGVSVLPSRTSLYRGGDVGLPACSLVENIEYFDPDSVQVVTSTYSALAKQRSALLDIIKKSQQRPRKHASYGRVQSVKRFTAAAKQRILEAGAVVDKHTKRENQRELTVTLPGSGWRVYDVVSRWSGWIVNRMTQVVRRLEKEGYNLYWFFVWEHQKRGALHQHWCIASDESPEFTHNVARLLLRKWFDLLIELSEKTGIDLFQKKGSFGTWRYSRDKWQYNIAPIKKGVARYFSKYCSKNSDTSQYNQRRRNSSTKFKGDAFDSSGRVSVYSLCPSRYWGCNSRIKRLCAHYRVTISLDVASKRESDFLAETISKWLHKLSPELQKVSRTFKATQTETGFVYADGYEYRAWVSEASFKTILALFRALRLHQIRKTDAVQAICDFDELLESLFNTE